ncbi:GntR family transcriptional regulator [Paraburkholderia sp. MPAMCS5]|uniref:GntR family transcriptional regulator n=1 Tax=Paraburkholderia sp. MPAMCS5 TaxID=3112563 RepID=UPI002E19CBAD|nr:GntR family transcriptional regulator [Paraburkholderia sp. MPAMCS5]
MTRYRSTPVSSPDLVADAMSGDAASEGHAFEDEADEGNAHRPRTAGNASQTERTLLGLRELIVEGHLVAGARISELWVVDRLGVSRTPVRAALNRLEEEGLLEPIASGGFAVRSFTVDDVGDSIELRGTLEGLAVRLAAERGVDAAQLKKLHALIDEIDAILAGELTDETFSAYVEANRRLHAQLTAACNSRVIERQIERVMTMPFASPSAFVIAQSIDASARDMLRIAQSQHVAVVESIERREGARAEALMREHARIARHNLHAALQNQNVMTQVPGGKLIRLPIGR